ncbi:MAG: hypothetical protein J7D60_10985 [Prosthecochloris sp.]|nr:hypothetical protein [Prosthecochloris sp.]
MKVLDAVEGTFSQVQSLIKDALKKKNCRSSEKRFGSKGKVFYFRGPLENGGRRNSRMFFDRYWQGKSAGFGDDESRKKVEKVFGKVIVIV